MMSWQRLLVRFAHFKVNTLTSNALQCILSIMEGVALLDKIQAAKFSLLNKQAINNELVHPCHRIVNKQKGHSSRNL